MYPVHAVPLGNPWVLHNTEHSLGADRICFLPALSGSSEVAAVLSCHGCDVGTVSVALWGQNAESLSYLTGCSMSIAWGHRGASTVAVTCHL